MNEIANGRTCAALLILLLSLTGLLVAFLLSLDAAERHFDRAAAAQAQLAAVLRIEALAATDRPGPELAAALSDYRTSIGDEERLLASPFEMARQRQEARDAERLSAEAMAPGGPSRLRDLIAHIARLERREVATVEAAMDRLRHRTMLFALLLAGAAFGATLAGIAALLGTNRRLLRQVEARTSELRAVDQSRRLFFAKASHELRTPITVMRGEAEVSLADPRADTAQLRESLRHVVANAEFLGRRVEELLGLSKADDGRLCLMPETIDLADLLRGTVHLADGYARSADVRVELRIPDQPFPVAADPRWMAQALLAVIDNGIKFSPEGGVVRLLVRMDQEEARIMVADEGPGVMAEALPRIFDAYYQTEVGRTRGGTGLGLALARWVVEQHGGSVVAANQPEGGCCIALTLPRGMAA